MTISFALINKNESTLKINSKHEQKLYLKGIYMYHLLAWLFIEPWARKNAAVRGEGPPSLTSSTNNGYKLKDVYTNIYPE